MEYGGFPGGSWKNGCDKVDIYEIYDHIYNGVNGMPRVWNRFGIYPCCSTFFVKTKVVRRRPKSDYKLLFDNAREWVRTKNDTKMRCGFLFEYTWHMLFTGKDIIVPPPDFKRKYNHNFTRRICQYNTSDM